MIMPDENGNITKTVYNDSGMNYEVRARLTRIPKNNPLVCKTCDQDATMLVAEKIISITRKDDCRSIELNTPIAKRISEIFSEEIRFLDLPGNKSCQCRDRPPSK